VKLQECFDLVENDLVKELKLYNNIYVMMDSVSSILENYKEDTLPFIKNIGESLISIREELEPGVDTGPVTAESVMQFNSWVGRIIDEFSIPSKEEYLKIMNSIYLGLVKLVHEVNINADNLKHNPFSKFGENEIETFIHAERNVDQKEVDKIMDDLCNETIPSIKELLS
jgi:hypothetical protein